MAAHKTNISARKERKIARSVGIRPIKQSFLIICEGENTEPEYFNSFRLTSAKVKAVGKGMGTLALLREALSIRKEETRKGHVFDQCWLVFDKDDFPDGDFNEAIRKGEAEGFRVAWSNQSFEFWFILHFIQHHGPMHRREYPAVLTRLTGRAYSKSQGFTKLIFNQLYPLTDVAISNARNVLQDMDISFPAKAESATTVFALVEELKKYI